MQRKIRYYVSYGAATSRAAFYTLEDAKDFISDCLNNDIPVTGVTKA